MSDLEEIKKAVRERLEKAGLVSSLKAKLQSEIFQTFESDHFRRENQSQNVKLKRFLEDNEDSQRILFLVSDLLRKLDLKGTAQVFESETRFKPNEKTRDECLKTLDLTDNLNDSPLISRLYSNSKQKSTHLNVKGASDVDSSLSELHTARLANSKQQKEIIISPRSNNPDDEGRLTNINGTDAEMTDSHAEASQDSDIDEIIEKDPTSNYISTNVSSSKQGVLELTKGDNTTPTPQSLPPAPSPDPTPSTNNNPESKEPSGGLPQPPDSSSLMEGEGLL